jgi:Na+/H+ antiporter NhaD/arsenite permease-like protein
MGANTHIGNAPNFMVRLICEERGIKMPSFIGYMLWSSAILLPLFALSPGSGSREPRPRAASPLVWK